MIFGIDARTALLKRKGGFGIYTRNLIKSMAINFPEHLFNLFYNNKFEESIGDFKNVNYQSLYFPLNAFWTKIRLPLEFLNYKPDVFLFPCQTMTRYSSSKKIVTIHDLRFKAIQHHNKAEYIRLDHQVKNSIKYSDRIICVSKQTKSDLIKFYNADYSKIKVIYHGADHIPEIKKNSSIVKFDKIRKKYKIPKNFLLTVGYTMKHKNIPSVVKCLKKVIDSGRKIKLVIIGPKGDDENNLFKIIHRLNLENEVIRIPYVNSTYLPYFYFNSKLFIYPSLYEGFGLPILEAMRSGAAVIGSKAGSIPEIGGDAMSYFDPNNDEEIAYKIINLIDSKEKIDKMKIEGYLRAKNFKWDQTAKSTIDFIQT